jgi:hypothetical protein
MAGEIGLIRPAEVEEYAATAASNDIDELHFYTMDQPVSQSVLEAIAAT